MKKLILSALVVGSLLATSCKDAKDAGNSLKNGATTVVSEGADALKNGAEDLAKKATEAVGLDGIEIPEFSDPKVTEYLTEYSAYAKEYISGGANVASNTELMTKGTELATKAQEVMKGMDAETMTKFSKVLTDIASKMAPAVAK